MSRVTTSNYGAVATTQFAWATTDDDLFDREKDLYFLAQAVENHDHSAGRGLSVARVSANAVPSTALQALSVTEDKIAAGAVTNTKLGAGAVTRDKISWPLVQSIDNITGGIRLRETTNVYEVAYYIATSGHAVFSAGVVGNAGTGNLILHQGGAVSFGTAGGAARVNILQAVDGATNIASGLRIYNPNTGFFNDIVNYSGHLAIAAQGVGAIWVDAGNRYVTLGSAINSFARLTIAQAAGTAAEGFLSFFGGGLARYYVDTSGNAVLASATTSVQLEHAAAVFGPTANAGATLGQPGKVWGNAHVSALNATTGTFTGAVSGITTLSAGSASITGSATANAIVVTGGHLLPSVNNTNVLGQSGLGFQGGYIGAAIFDANGIFPLTNNTKIIGSSPSNIWAAITVTNGFKPGGGSWTDTSDIRTKMTTKFRPYEAGLAEVLRLEPTWYTYNGDYGTPRGKEFAGFRAEELKEVAPDMVSTQKIRKRTEDDPEEDILMVNLSNLPLMLVNAVKELKAEINDLRQQLKDRNN